MPLTIGEKLNAILGKLRDYRVLAPKFPLLVKTVAIQNTRYAHFDIVARVATIEIEELDVSLRFDALRRQVRLLIDFCARVVDKGTMS
jgi:hypothetical protein